MSSIGQSTKITNQMSMIKSNEKKEIRTDRNERKIGTMHYCYRRNYNWGNKFQMMQLNLLFVWQPTYIIITVTWSIGSDHAELPGADHQNQQDAKRQVWSADPRLATRRDPTFWSSYYYYDKFIIYLFING